MVKIRLQRRGSRNRPCYRVVAIDERDKRDGRALEFLGTYDPIARPVAIHLELEKIEAWRQRGARLSDAVSALVRRARKAAPAEAAAAAKS
jgi:small subunit ribosomal protein S16